MVLQQSRVAVLDAAEQAGRSLYVCEQERDVPCGQLVTRWAHCLDIDVQVVGGLPRAVDAG